MLASILLIGLGVWEITLIVVVLLLFFGASRLPQLAKGLGGAVREFKAGKDSPSEKEERLGDGDNAGNGTEA